MSVRQTTESFPSAVLLPHFVKALKTADVYRVGRKVYVRVAGTKVLLDIETMTTVDKRPVTGKPITPNDIPSALGLDGLRNIKNMKPAEQKTFLHEFQSYLDAAGFLFDGPSLCRSHGVDKLEHVSATMLAETFGGVHGLIAHLVTAKTTPLTARPDTPDLKQSPRETSTPVKGSSFSCGNSKSAPVIEISDDESEDDTTSVAASSRSAEPLTPTRHQVPKPEPRPQPAAARTLFGGVVSAVTNAFRGATPVSSVSAAASASVSAASAPSASALPSPVSFVGVHEEDEDEEDEDENEDDDDQDIYGVTAKGKSAHRLGCRYAEVFIRQMSLSEAKAEDWPLCKVCCKSEAAAPVAPALAPAPAHAAPSFVRAAPSPVSVRPVQPEVSVSRQAAVPSVSRQAAVAPSPAPSSAPVPVYGVVVSGGGKCFHHPQGRCSTKYTMNMVSLNSVGDLKPCGICKPLGV
jgi:hypothetical protein